MPFIPIFIALVAALGTFQQLEAKRRQQEYESDVMRANALAKEQQAEIIRRKGELDRRAIDREKMAAKAKYRRQAGMNISMLNNVDISSGSPLAMLEGNLNRFADDMGELEYKKDLTKWEAERAYDVKLWDVLSSQSSFLKQTAGSTGQSLLIAGLTGTASGLSAHSMIGGTKKTVASGGGGGGLAATFPTQ
jgi:hypothetical protein